MDTRTLLEQKQQKISDTIKMALVFFLQNILALLNNVFRKTAHPVTSIRIPRNLVSVQVHQNISSVDCKYHLIYSELRWVR